MLYHFLDKLGPEKCRLLKDIAICHPGFAALPEFDPPCQHGEGSAPVTGVYYDLFDDHMRAFCFGPTMRGGYPALNSDTNWNAWQQFDGTALLLAECSGLVRLTLTLPQFQYPSEQHPFAGLQDHPIQAFEWPQGDNLDLSILHLVSGRHDWTDKRRMQHCMDDIYTTSAAPKRITYRIPNSIRSNRRNLISADRARDAREFFDAVKESGWRVKAMFYDHRGNYPVQHGQGCASEAVCSFLDRTAMYGLWYYCPGNREEAMAHPGVNWWATREEERKRVEEVGMTEGGDF